MTVNRCKWDRLQARWAAGEELTPEEERERLTDALGDPLAERELELYGDLLAQVSVREPSDADRALIARVLERARLRPEPRLRLVRADHAAAPRPRLPGLWSRRSVWVGALASASAVVLGFAFLWTRDASQHTEPSRARATPAARAPALARAELVFASGRVWKGDGPADVGRATLRVGERVTTGEGHACLTIDPTIDVCLGEASRVVLDSLADHEIRVQVDEGTVVAVLGKRSRAHSFALAAGDVAAVAHGTAFAVTRSPDTRAASVAVLEGEVDVTERGRPATRLAAHFRLDVGSAWSGARAASMGRGDEARFWRLLAPRELWQGTELGILDIAPSSDGTRVLLEQEGPLALPLRTFVPAGERRVVWRNPAGQETTLAVEVSAGERRTLEPQPLGRATPTGVRSGTDTSPTELLAEARRELGRGNRKGALALYQRLRVAYPQAPEAFTVLVTLGKLELEVSSPARALAMFEAYLRRGGPLSPEATAGKIRALRGLGRASDERAAIEQYLARYPTGLDAPWLKKRLDALSSP